MKKALALSLLLLAISVAVTVRLYPALISGMPFSVDAWPLIRNTELLSQNTPVSLTSGVFDGYNNYWPAVQLFGAVLSELSALPAASAMAYAVPLAAALAVPLFYLIVKKLTGSTAASLAAAFLLATVFPYALFTAGVTKETFASPLYLCLIFVFLQKHNAKSLGLFLVLSLVLVLTHHFTAFLAVAILSGLTAASFITKKGLSDKANSPQSNLLYLAAFAGANSLYFALFAYPALNFTITLSDLLSVGAYEVLLASLIIYLCYAAKPFTALKTALYCGGWTLMLALLVLLTTQIPILPSAPTLPLRYLLYALPTLLGLPLVIYGFRELRRRQSFLLAPFFWVAAVAAFGIWALFSNALGGYGFVYRSINFILPPFLILAALGLWQLVGNRKMQRRLWVAFAVVLVAFMAVLGCFSVYAAVALEEPYFGYFWRYSPSEYHAADWTAASVANQTVAGDSKIHYLLSDYFECGVDIMGGYRFLGENASAPQLLFVYGQMYRNGYVLYDGSPAALPANWTDKLANYNCVYVNSEVTIYANP
ncbi:MAG: hypothetical protein NWE93_05960 [Candidatus Bathyarchaeota archaeon]|nr:hypothetical protein [Candidatus Bathyarchaeota archaeon]